MRPLLKRPVTVAMVYACVAVLGVIATNRLSLGFLPGIDWPEIYVSIPYHDSLPSEVERRIVKPVEEELATLSSVRHITARATEAGADFSLQFDWGRPIDLARLEVRERLDRVRPRLPADVRDFFIYSANVATDLPIIDVRMSPRDPDVSVVYEEVEARILRPLQRLDGVARAEVYGVAKPELRVEMDPDRLGAHAVDVGALARRISDATGGAVLGRLETRGRTRVVRSVPSATDAHQVADLPVGRGDLRLADVARVGRVHLSDSYQRRLNGRPAMGLAIYKESSANTVDVARRARAELERIQGADGGLELDFMVFYDQSEEITEAISGLRSAGMWGALLAVAVLLCFLRRLDATLLVALSIPLSIVVACSVLYLTDHSLNVIAMMGLMLGVGLLVDNSVVVMESIGRRLDLGHPSTEAAAEGTRDVVLAVVASTLTSVIIFLPFVLGEKNELTIWLEEAALTLTLSLGASLVISMTLIPMVASRLRRRKRVSTPVIDRWSDRYRRSLRVCLGHRWWTSAGIVVLCVLLVVPFKVFGLKGNVDREIALDFLGVEYEFHDNPSREKVLPVVETVEAWIEKQQEWLPYESCYTYYGDATAFTRLGLPRNEIGEDRWEEMRTRLRTELPEMAGVDLALFEMQDEDEEGAQEFRVFIRGEDPEALAELAGLARRQLDQVDGIEDLRSGIQRSRDEVRVSLDRERAARLGVSALDVQQMFGFTLRGTYLQRVRGEDGELDLMLSLAPGDQEGMDVIANLPVGSPEMGATVPLTSVAEVRRDRGPATIRRRDRRTGVSISGSYTTERFEDVRPAITATLDGLARDHFPIGYDWSFSERIEEQKEDFRAMGMNMGVSILLVFLVMAALFESLLFPFVILASIAFAGVGAFWLMLITNTPLGMMAMIGCLLLIGIVVNNGIILVDHINVRRRAGVPLEEAAVEGGAERLRPILMTATTTILGMVPLAIGETSVGDALYFPLARAVIGGLLSSTVLTLLLVPFLYVQGEGLRRAASRLWRRSDPGGDAPAVEPAMT